ncbi:MAG: sigma-70 family RNA polymerase sigma factor [Planctomycetota bacterium]
MPPSPESLIAHGDFLRALARRLLGDDHSAEDVVQTTYLRALAVPMPAAGLRAWLARAAQRVALNDRRSRQRRVRREAAAARSVDVPSTEDVVQREAVRQRVVQAVLGLEEPYRSTVLLRYFESLAPAEIAARLGVPASTVRSRLQRAHDALRQELDREPGGRAGWAAPLAALARPLAPAASPFPALVVGWLLMKNVLLGGAVAASVAAMAWLAYGAAVAAPSAGNTAAAATPAALPPAPETVAASVGVPPATAPRVAAAVAPAAPSADEPAASHVAALAGFRGRLVDETGTPLAACGVELFRLAFDALVSPVASGGVSLGAVAAARVSSAADGVFLVRGVRPRGLFLLHVGRDTARCATRLVQHAPQPGVIVDLGDIEVQASATITGTVVDADGAPVADATVVAIDLPAPMTAMAPLHAFDLAGAMILRQEMGPTQVLRLPGWLRTAVEDLPIPRARTAADGTFALAGVTPGRTSVGVAAAGWVPMLRSGVRVSAGATRDLGSLRLDLGETLEGRVLDAADRPVADAEVLAAPSPTLTPFALAAPLTRSDAEGWFTVTGLPRGRVTVAARRTAGQRWTVAPPQPVGGNVEVRLAGTATLTLRLESDAGLPVAAPRCELVPGAGMGLPELSALGMVPPLELGDRLQRDGSRWTLRDLVPGPYTLRVSDPEHADVARLVQLDEDLELTLTLAARAPLGVRVVDHSGDPVHGAKVYARPAGSAAWIGSMPMPAGATDAEGAVALDRVAGDPVQVVVTHPAFGELEGEASRGRDNVLAFGAPGSIDGVLHHSGRPADGAPWSVLLFAHGSPTPDLPMVAQAGSDGRFAFGALQPGSYRLRAVESVDGLLTPGAAFEMARFSWMPSHRTAEVDVVGGRGVEVKLNVADEPEISDEPSGRVRGSVLIDGEPTADVVVMIEVGAERPPMSTKSDGDGRFDAGLVPEGRWFVVAFDTEQRTFADNWPHMMWSGYVDVATTTPAEIQIDVQTASLAGEVRDAAGQAAPAAWVEVHGALASAEREGDGRVTTRYVVQSDSAGRFELSGIAPGAWQLAVRLEGRKEPVGQTEAFDLGAGAARTGLLLRIPQ